MTKKYIFVNPKTLEKIDRITAEMVSRWDYDSDLGWQVWDMVAVALVKSSRTCLVGDGIVVDGWNSEEFCSPQSAYGGFYRTEKHQAVAWILRYADHHTLEDYAQEFERLKGVYGVYDVYWEPRPRVWGYYCYREYYKEETARSFLEAARNQKRVKRAEVEYLELSGMWRVRWETTRKPPTNAEWREGFQTVIRLRIDKSGDEFAW